MNGAANRVLFVKDNTAPLDGRLTVEEGAEECAKHVLSTGVR